MKRIVLLISIAILAVGCHAQVPPATSAVVSLNWTAPSGGPYTFAVYRCSASAATCANLASTSWTEITTLASRPSGTAYTDASANGLTAFYNVETVAGTSHSSPSNTVGPLVVPAAPLAPTLNAPTLAENTPPINEPLLRTPVVAVVNLPQPIMLSAVVQTPWKR